MNDIPSEDREEHLPHKEDEAGQPQGSMPSGDELWRLLQDTGTTEGTDPKNSPGGQANPFAPTRELQPVDLPKPKVDEPRIPKELDYSPTAPPARKEPKPVEVPKDETEDISTLHKILTDPTAADTEVIEDRSKSRDADYDRAVMEYYRDADVKLKCKQHPELDAAGQCPECQAYFCQDCLVVRHGRMICKDCATATFVPTEEEVLTAHELGLDAPEAEITPEEKPEFQISSPLLGLEGRPASPIKRLGALLIDIVITRVFLLVVLAVLGVMFGSSSSAPAFHLFDTQPGESVVKNVFDAVVLFRPVQPWLIIFAVFDFLYFFITLAFWNRTIGMSWTGCRIVTEWGEFVSFPAIALRSLVFMVLFGWPAILIGWFFSGYRGPHDYAAGTVVINYAGVKRVDAYETVQIKL